MGQVTLRDLSTNEDIVVPPEGYIFGRVGGDADIQIEDNSISRRQARVSLKGGMWLLETLAVPQGSKAPRPVQLQEGASFTVGQSEFEVVQIEAEEDEPAAPTIAPGKGRPGPPPAAAKKPNPPSNAKTQASPQPAKKGAAPAPAGAAEEAPAGGGIKGLFVGVPKGIAYYLVNVPKLLVNPFGTVRKTIEELPAEPMGKTDLIGYALPSMLATALLGSIASGIGMLIGGGGFQLMLFIPIVPAVVAVVVAVITGFIFHPVVGWIITKLKGESDPRSRSNFFLQMQTLAIITAVPGALFTILNSLPVPFIGAIGLVLGVIASLASLYVSVQWIVFFKLVKWVKPVVLVLGALTALNSAWGVISYILHPKALGSGPTIAAVAGVDGDSGEVDLGEMPSDPAEAAEWSKKRAAAMTAAAQKKAQAAIDDANAKVADAKDKADDAKDDKADEPVKTTKKDPPPPKPEPAKDPEPVAAKDPEPVAKNTPPPPEPTVTPSAGYATFARRRDAIEKAFESDPTLLQKSADLQKLYGEYIEDAYDLEKKWGKESQKKPERARLNARLRDAELYGKSGKTIDSIAAKLGIK